MYTFCDVLLIFHFLQNEKILKIGGFMLFLVPDVFKTSNFSQLLSILDSVTPVWVGGF